jgi:uncharacterized protein (DUF427 family)
MAKAIWNNTVIAESSETIIVEGNHYFPPDTIKCDYFQENSQHTTCSWKGVASYYDITVEGKTNQSSAWFYPEPKSAADNIKNYGAFWRGVQVEP